MREQLYTLSSRDAAESTESTSTGINTHDAHQGRQAARTECCWWGGAVNKSLPTIPVLCYFIFHRYSINPAGVRESQGRESTAAMHRCTVYRPLSSATEKRSTISWTRPRTPTTSTPCVGESSGLDEESPSPLSCWLLLATTTTSSLQPPSVRGRPTLRMCNSAITSLMTLPLSTAASNRAHSHSPAVLFTTTSDRADTFNADRVFCLLAGANDAQQQATVTRCYYYTRPGNRRVPACPRSRQHFRQALTGTANC